MRIVERVAGHYEAQEVEFGRVYTWNPECVVAECDCGKRATFKRSDVVEGLVPLASAAWIIRLVFRRSWLAIRWTRKIRSSIPGVTGTLLGKLDYPSRRLLLGGCALKRASNKC